ncbi:MAG: hypothetical protein V1668_02985 [Patescibacteria group bacterium]
MEEQKKSEEPIQTGGMNHDPRVSRKLMMVKLQFWLGLVGIIAVGLGIAVYFIFLKNPSSAQVIAIGADDPRCQTWTAGACEDGSGGGFYFDPQSDRCLAFSGGPACSQPPFVSQADCAAVCIRGEKENAQAVDANAAIVRNPFNLDCTLASGAFKLGDDTGAKPDSDGQPVGLGRCHIASADANQLHILLLWQVFVDGQVWYTTDMRFPDPVTSSFAKEVAIASGYDAGVFSYDQKFTRAGEYKVVFSVFDCADVEKKLKGSCSNTDETKNIDIIAKVAPLQSIEKSFTVQ